MIRTYTHPARHWVNIETDEALTIPRKDDVVIFADITVASIAVTPNPLTKEGQEVKITIKDPTASGNSVTFEGQSVTGNGSTLRSTFLDGAWLTEVSPGGGGGVTTAEMNAAIATAIDVAHTPVNYTAAGPSVEQQIVGIDVALRPAWSKVGATYTAKNKDSVYTDVASTIIAPSPAQDKDEFRVARAGSQTISLVSTDGSTFNFLPSATINKAGVVELSYDAATHNWVLIGDGVVYPEFITNTLHANAVSTLSIKLEGDSTARIVWGDGSSTAADGSVQAHNYAAPYTGDVTIIHSGTATTLEFVGGWDFNPSVLGGFAPTRLVFGAGSNIPGGFADIPANCGSQTLSIQGAGPGGPLSTIPSTCGLHTVALQGTCAPSGDVNSMQVGVAASRFFVTSPNSTVIGDFSTKTGFATSYLLVTMAELTYSGGAPSPYGRMTIRSTVMTSAMFDQLLLDLAAGAVTNQIIDLAGANAGRTAASDAAVATLQGRGCTVTTN